MNELSFQSDHLGNIRLAYMPEIFNDINLGCMVRYHVQSVMDYFPYGKHLRVWFAGEPERWQTTLNERDAESGLDYRGARYYDSEYGRFLGIDPLAGQFPGWSPYNYVFGRPTLLIDPGGMSPEGGDQTSAGGGGMWNIGGMYFSAVATVTITDDDGGYSTNSFYEEGHNLGRMAWGFVSSVGKGYFNFHYTLFDGLVDPYKQLFKGPQNYLDYSKSRIDGLVKAAGQGEFWTSMIETVNIPAMAYKGIRYASTHSAEQSANAFGYWVGNEAIPSVAMALGGEALMAESAIVKAEARVVAKLEAEIGEQMTKELSSLGGEGYGKIYRAVSKAELDDILEYGFRNKAGGYELEKLFAPTMDEAARFGRNNFMFDGIPNTIVKVRVPSSVLKNAFKFEADGMNVISIPSKELHYLKGTPMNSSPLIH